MAGLRKRLRHLVSRCAHGPRLYVLNYHRVCAAHALGSGVGTETSFEAFVENLDAIASRYRTVDLFTWLTDEASRPREDCVAITFDDGHGSVLEFALPALKARRIPGTLFLNTGYWAQERRVCWSDAAIPGAKVRIGDAEEGFESAVRRARTTSDPAVYRAYVEAIEAVVAGYESAGRGYLKRSQWNDLSSGSLRIGLHGHYHHRHSMYDEGWQEQNLLRNQAELSEHPRYVPMMALPFGQAGDVDAISLAVCRRHGVIPVLHNGGYNTRRTTVVRRIAGDGRDALPLIEGQSPFLHRYDVH